MMKRPPGMDRATWRVERDAVWRRRNRIFTIFMIAAVIAVLVRYFAS